MFRFPLKNIDDFKDSNEKVCVVSIIGKSSCVNSAAKASILNAIIPDHRFKNPLKDQYDKNDTCLIEGYHDAENNIIYLHMTSLYDAEMLANISTNDEGSPSNKTEFYRLWHEEDYKYTKSMLYIFSVSHIILINLPGTCFDVSYIRLFRTIDTIRVKLQPIVTDQLKSLAISKDWKVAGRPCSPRVLFCIENSNLDTVLAENETRNSDSILAENDVNSNQHKSGAPIKILQHAIEDQIYHVLRKSRVITNTSNNSLFAVPANQEFVHIGGHRDEINDSVDFYLNQLRQGCLNTRESEGPKAHSYQTMRRGLQGSLSVETVSRTPPAVDLNCLKEFLWQHIDLALTKGFNDNVGRNPVQPLFELPSALTWFKVSDKLYNFFLDEAQEGPAKASFVTLKSLLDIDTRFSESRCHKVLPLAESAYQEGLPQFYTRNYHHTKLSHARHVFLQHARGPASDKYLVDLDEACERIWQNGRRQCENISMTGQACMNELHHTSEIVEPDSASLPAMPHCSQIQTKAACNCGRKQTEREDPFTHKEANWEFYAAILDSCCAKLDAIQLPVFKPSTTDINAQHEDTARTLPPPNSPPGGGGLQPGGGSAAMAEIGKSPAIRKESDVVPMSNLSLALSLGQSGSSQLYTHSGDQSASTEHSVGSAQQPQESQSLPDNHHHSNGNHRGDELESSKQQESDDEPLETVSSGLQTRVKMTCAIHRQHSGVESLPGMVHSKSPAGLLPRFSSWSLLVLGRYTSYSHAHGLDQPGFCHGSNFLTPWDITIKVDKDKWPAISESKKGKGKKGHREAGELILKVFIGNEYECPRGHRFFMCGPDKMVRASVATAGKDGLNKLLMMDMPLYFPCQCRSIKGHMAQLMRVFVAAPEGPMHVTLNPKIQPARDPCPVFYPGNDQPISVPPGMVSVLRLPYVYVGDTGPYYMPEDNQLLGDCRLLKGLYGYTETAPK